MQSEEAAPRDGFHGNAVLTSSLSAAQPPSLSLPQSLPRFPSPGMAHLDQPWGLELGTSLSTGAQWVLSEQLWPGQQVSHRTFEAGRDL